MNTKDIEEIKKSPAYIALMTKWGQLDEDGISIAVSRQALEETIAMFETALTTLTQHHEAEVERATKFNCAECRAQGAIAERERILAEISNCQQEHNIARHGDTVDEIYDRVHDYIKFTTAPTKTDK